MQLHAGDRRIDFPRSPLVMGIVNITDDSFSGDGVLDPDAAITTARHMVAQGADIIDVGAESARTTRSAIPVAEEIARLTSFITRFHQTGAESRWPAPSDHRQVFPPLLSINTWRSDVVGAVLPLGAHILNDIGALPDAWNAALCARHDTALLIMHSVGEPKKRHTHCDYQDVIATIDSFFTEKIALARSTGLPIERIILDPGLDFAKQLDDNLRILARLDRFEHFKRPILLPVSRKTLIGNVLGIDDPAARDAGTIACLTAGVLRGAHILRVHNVAAARRSIRVLEAVDQPGIR